MLLFVSPFFISLSFGRWFDDKSLAARRDGEAVNMPTAHLVPCATRCSCTMLASMDGLNLQAHILTSRDILWLVPKHLRHGFTQATAVLPFTLSQLLSRAW